MTTVELQPGAAGIQQLYEGLEEAKDQAVDRLDYREFQKVLNDANHPVRGLYSSIFRAEGGVR